MYKLAVAFPALIVALVDCSPPETNCTEEARASVVVDIQDADGNPIDDVDVVYTVDGGAEEDCQAGSNPGEFICGYEVEGNIEVFAVTDTEEGSMSFDIDADACHVNGQAGTIVL